MHSYEYSLYCATLSVYDLEQAEICEKYNNPKRNNWWKKQAKEQ